MTQFLLKTLISAVIIAGVSELGKRSTVAAAVLASLPLTSMLAMMWLYHDTKDTAKVAALSHGIFWAVLPSLLFFIALPLFLKTGKGFWWAMAGASAAMVTAYAAYVWALPKLGVRPLS
jgi:hypothetical protein